MLALPLLLVGSVTASLASSASASVSADIRAQIRVESAPGPPNSTNVRIGWATGDQSVGEVYVSINGGAEKLFARGRSGSQEAPWLVKGNAYVFRLYRRGRTKLLASVTVPQRGLPSDARKVRSAPAVPRLTAQPNPVPVDDGTGTTSIKWTTGSAKAGEVYVSENGAREKLLSRGRSGSVRAPWIRVGRTYVFHLYSGSHTRPVAATVVRAISPVATRPSSPGTNPWLWVVLGGAIGLVVLGGLYFSRRGC